MAMPGSSAVLRRGGRADVAADDPASAATVPADHHHGYLMQRHCDGTDPNLIRPDGTPCDCGASFDDIDWTVIYPHQRIPSQAEKQVIVDRLITDLTAAGFFEADPDSPDGLRVAEFFDPIEWQPRR
jgi:hypothetical protein